MARPVARPLVADLPLSVRDDAAAVMREAAHVAINYAAIPVVARDVVASGQIVTTLDTVNHFVDRSQPALTAAYVLLLDTLNFGSGYFADAQRAGVDIEYAPVAQSLKHAFENGVMTEVSAWHDVTPADMHRIFNIPAGFTEPLDSLMRQFATQAQLTAQEMQSSGFSLAWQLLEYAGGSAVKLAGLLAGWKSFDDAPVYKGSKRAVYKRAQICAADMHLALSTPEQPLFHDIDTLTMFADNMVPHVLRHMGVLTYTPALAAKIDQGVFIGAGSTEEVEIRMAAIHAVELIKKHLHAEGRTEISSMNIDHLLWHYGYQQPFIALPKHKTKTTAY